MFGQEKVSIGLDCSRVRFLCWRGGSQEARAETLTPKAGGTTESGGPGGFQASDQAELSSQGQL